LLPTAEEALALERAVRREIVKRKLQNLQSGEERPRTEKEGVDYLVQRFREDGYL
jgi:hypothetical protein